MVYFLGHPCRRILGTIFLGGVVCLLSGLPARAATGLNQIVSPDIQPAGLLSVNEQLQDARIGNSQELQLELGLSRQAEVLFSQGLRPREEIVGAKIGLLQKGPNLLTTGVVNWSSRGGGASPLLEYGYYATNDHFIAGAIYSTKRTEGVFGHSHQFTGKFQVAFDYQSGPGNAVTAGFAYNFTPDLQVNPAIFMANTRPHRALGYIILNWNIPLWH
ncbi:MAG TPA: hypothetical protein VNW23_00990 [Opitutaceae bacterium]|jgi:hypothetical protein|nr:hypothetical protein [Opitutaceae bacterium]